MNNLLKILIYPNPGLNQKSLPVNDDYIYSEDIKTLVDDMFWTMYRHKGVGLSAVQVGRPIRLFIMDCSKDPYRLINNTNPKPMVLINPVIKEYIDNKIEMSEGCLSFPGVYENTMRYPEIIVEAKDFSGGVKRWQMAGLEAQCVQHEIEHLDGVTMGTNWGRVKRDIAKRKIHKALDEFTTHNN